MEFFAERVQKIGKQRDRMAQLPYCRLIRRLSGVAYSPPVCNIDFPVAAWCSKGLQYLLLVWSCKCGSALKREVRSSSQGGVKLFVELFQKSRKTKS